MGTVKHAGCSRIHCCDTPNDTVQMLETTAKRHILLSPTDDEPPLCSPLPVLPDELIIKILLRLPVRSLLQFRCVCKLWKTLISDPHFVKDHLRLSISAPSMTRQWVITSITDGKREFESFSVQSLLQNPSTPDKALSFRMKDKYEILGSCNGLLCLHDICSGHFKLWNPFTRLESKKSPTLVTHDGVVPFRRITYHGFGYDQVNDKYKVLVVMKGNYGTVTKVYTFGANSWTTVQNFPYLGHKYLGNFVSGTLNWMAPDQWVILSFDMEKEIFGEVLLPLQQDGDEVMYPLLDILNNCLSICFECNRTHWVVWLMKKFGVQESWTKLTVVSHETLQISSWVPLFNPWSNITTYNSLCITENGVVLARLLNYPRTWRKRGMHFHIYNESLVSP